MPIRYSLSSVSKIRHILSVIHYKTRTVCFQSTHFPCDDWDNIFTLSYFHHRIGSMNYYPWFRARSWNNGVRCMSFCILLRHYIVAKMTVCRKKYSLYTARFTNNAHSSCCFGLFWDREFFDVGVDKTSRTKQSTIQPGAQVMLDTLNRVFRYWCVNGGRDVLVDKNLAQTTLCWG